MISLFSLADKCDVKRYSSNYGNWTHMHIREIDWRIDTLEYVVVGIDADLAAIDTRIGNPEWYDGGHALDDVEPLLGLGLVAFQTYAAGTVSDLNQIRRSRGKTALTKRHCYNHDSAKVNGVVTRIQLINSAANYFKHHDEWDLWPTGKQIGAQDVKNLALLGITQRTEHPCIKAVELLSGTSWKMIVVHQIVREWRAYIFSELR